MGYSRPRLVTVSLADTAPVNPSDSTVYYAGMIAYGWGTSAGTRRTYLPVSGHIRKAIFNIFALTTVGSAEDVVIAIRLNNTTDYTFATVGAAAQNRTFANYALNIPVSAGDYIEMKITTPAWATNPEGVYTSGSVVVETA